MMRNIQIGKRVYFYSHVLKIKSYFAKFMKTLDDKIKK